MHACITLTGCATKGPPCSKRKKRELRNSGGGSRQFTVDNNCRRTLQLTPVEPFELLCLENTTSRFGLVPFVVS
jgi:hypothetical protein